MADAREDDGEAPGVVLEGEVDVHAKDAWDKGAAGDGEGRDGDEHVGGRAGLEGEGGRIGTPEPVWQRVVLGRILLGYFVLGWESRVGAIQEGEGEGGLLEFDHPFHDSILRPTGRNCTCVCQHKCACACVCVRVRVCE